MGMRRPEEPSSKQGVSLIQSEGGGVDIVPMTRTYDYPYFNLRLTWGEVEAEEYRVRVLKGRAACSRGGPGCGRLHDGGGAGFLLPESGPNSPPTLVLEKALG